MRNIPLISGDKEKFPKILITFTDDTIEIPSVRKPKFLLET